MTRKQSGAGPSKPPARKRVKLGEAAPDAEEDNQFASDDSGLEYGSSDGDDDSFPDNSTDNSEDPEGSSEDGEDEAQEINVEFDFFDPEEKDFLGLKALLSGYLNGEQFDSSGLIDTIIAETDYVGSVVKTDADDDPIAVMSVLSTTKYKDKPFMKQIRQFLLDSCQGKTADMKATVEKAFDSPDTGLLINERLLNAPPKLAPPLLQFIMQEVQDMLKDPEELSQWYRFKRYILATRVYKDTQAANQGQAGPSRQHKQSEGDDSSPPLVFTRPEDEYLYAQCDWSYTFPVEGRPVTKDGLLAHRLVMQVDAKRVPAAQAELDRVVGNMAAGVIVNQGDDDLTPQGVNTEAQDTHQDIQKGSKQAGKAPKQGAGSAGGSGLNGADIARMAAEAFATAAAAGAGRGAGQGGGKKKKKAKVSTVTL